MVEEIIPFNSRPHEEADAQMVTLAVFDQSFNSRPHEEADAESVGQQAFLMAFNSRPHEEADYQAAAVSAALTDLSTHGLTRRPTLSRIKIVLDFRSFNSRPHEEADNVHRGPRPLADLSTHGLTRRPTRTCPGSWMLYRAFNSRPHEEADVSTSTLNTQFFFQLTASRGGRLEFFHIFSAHPSFNSRPHEEADWAGTTSHRRSYLSTHGLTRRPTYVRCFNATKAYPFNSRPHEEADNIPSKCWGVKRSFNSRPHEEADGGRDRTGDLRGIFQLTASRGGRLRAHLDSPKIINLSTHGLTRRPTGTGDGSLLGRKRFQLTASRGGRPGK